MNAIGILVLIPQAAAEVVFASSRLIHENGSAEGNHSHHSREVGLRWCSLVRTLSDAPQKGSRMRDGRPLRLSGASATSGVCRCRGRATEAGTAPAGRR